MHSIINNTSTGEVTRVLTRRLCFGLLIALIPVPAFARPSLGDEEWMRRFRVFVRMFNEFIEVLNEGRFDLSKWKAMRIAWREIDAG